MLLKNIVLSVGLLFILLACEKNHTPIISTVSQDPATTSAGTTYSFGVKASDEDGDVMQYLWAADQGEFLSPTNKREVRWRSPTTGQGESFTIIVTVSDGELETIKEHTIRLTDPIFGSISGYVYFTNSKIQISGVLVKIADKESFTDISGHYSIVDLVSGQDTLKTGKKDFSPKELMVSIPPNTDLKFNVEMTSVTNSTKAFGVITDQEGKPLANAQIVILNPDGSESKLSATTDENGLYRILYIPHGSRSIIIRKSSNDDFRYTDIKQDIDFTIIEQRLDFVVEKISLRGQFTDARDNQDYFYKTIGNQTWMTSNLRYLPQVNSPEGLTDREAKYYVYAYLGNDLSVAKRQENYLNYGVLYNWKSATKACPEGWHLPTKGEWETLVGGLEPRTAYKIKTISGWLNSGNGDNSSGFSALPAGSLTKDSRFSHLGSSTAFYSSTEMTTTIAWGVFLYSESETVWDYSDSKKAGYSVRCIRNL